MPATLVYFSQFAVMPIVLLFSFLFSVIFALANMVFLFMPIQVSYACFAYAIVVVIFYLIYGVTRYISFDHMLAEFKILFYAFVFDIKHMFAKYILRSDKKLDIDDFDYAMLKYTAYAKVKYPISISYTTTFGDIALSKIKKEVAKRFNIKYFDVMSFVIKYCSENKLGVSNKAYTHDSIKHRYEMRKSEAVGLYLLIEFKEHEKFLKNATDDELLSYLNFFTLPTLS
tara:strand:- start:984 stop:1667 length:684 start_codon:yes stop_codon:yes gene_type:complete